MDKMTIIWLAAAILLAVIEAATVQLVTIWFALGAVAACVTSLFTDSILIQIIVFVAMAAITLIATRPLVKKFRKKEAEPTNADRYIGRDAVVVSDIDNLKAEGRVKVDNAVWTARSEDGSPIPEGTDVVVTAIRGVKLIVVKKK